MASTGRSNADPDVVATQHDMARVLSQLSEVVASNRDNTDGDDAERRRRLKRRADVQRDAPKYDGSTDFDAWWLKIRTYLCEQEVDESDEKLIIAKNSTTGKAAEYLGAMEDQPDSMQELSQLLAKRFGKSRLKKLQEFNALQQKAGQSLRDYYDCVQRASLGLHKDEEELIDKFLRRLTNKRTHMNLVNLKFECLQDALEAAERYEELDHDSRPPLRSQPTS